MSIWRIALQGAIAGLTYQLSHTILAVALVFVLLHVSIDFLAGLHEGIVDELKAYREE